MRKEGRILREIKANSKILIIIEKGFIINQSFAKHALKENAYFCTSLKSHYLRSDHDYLEHIY